MRLIDADELKAVFEEKSSEAVCGVELCKAIVSRINNAPTVDAVPVIRCRECKYFECDHFDAVYFPTETGEAERVPLITAHEICTRWGDGCKTSEDGYCFMAERKDYETD